MQTRTVDHRWRQRGALALPILCAAGCFGPLLIGDGYLGVTGHVYESVGSTAGRGLVFVDAERSPSLSASEKPVAGCVITLEPWVPTRRPDDPETARLFMSRATSDASGRFNVGGTARPGTYDATLSIACDGFAPITRVFRHDRFKHEALAFVVQNK